MPLANVFWSCGGDFKANTRVKRLADINTDMQIGGGKFTQDNYTLINIHGPTAIWACALFAILVILGIVLRVMWTRRRKKMKRVVHRHRAAALRGYHRPDCMKLDSARECNCKKEVGQEGYRCYDDDDSVPSGSPLWLGP